MTTLPDVDSARALAGALVAERLAACASVGAAVESIYHWNGAVETATEVPLCVKTRAGLFAAAAAAIRARHPYELPEIVAVDITHGSLPYLDWIRAETREPQDL
ncbi:MAG: divalent-cation tolerance protein CutA [Proteobacteria bacterium]|nr:divalent-cation tolerance protein CutA [Pseudomonadota bacterium]